jgi:hypothetical protein
METWTVSVAGARGPLSVASSQFGSPSGKLRARPLSVPPSAFSTLTVCANGAGPPRVAEKNRLVGESRMTGVSVSVKIAVTVRSALIATVAGLVVPVKPPSQRENAKPRAGVAVRVTTVPGSYWASSGDRAMVPPLVGEATTVNVYRTVAVKTALTLFPASIVTDVGLAVPEASPSQRVNS